MMEKITSYKGFNKDMTCRDFRYKEGESYEEPRAEACERGFHACEYPLDCLDYYSPNESVHHVVEQSGEISRHSDDTKVASAKIKIGAKINIAGLVKAAIEYTMKRVNPEAKADESKGASSAGDPESVAVAWGYHGKQKVFSVPILFWLTGKAMKMIIGIRTYGSLRELKWFALMEKSSNPTLTTR